MEKGAQSRHLRLSSTSMGSPHHGESPPWLPATSEMSSVVPSGVGLSSLKSPYWLTCPYPAGFAISHSSRYHGDLCLRADLLSDQSHVHLGCQVVFWNLKVTVRRFSGLNNVQAYVVETNRDCLVLVCLAE